MVECGLPAKVQNGQLLVLTGTRWRKGEVKACEWCGKEFNRVLGATPHSQRRFCSIECRAAARQARNLKKFPAKTCAICGGLFKPQTSHASRHRTCGNPRCRFLLASQVRTEIHARRRAEAVSKANKLKEKI